MTDAERIEDEARIYERGRTEGEQDISKLRMLLAINHGCGASRMYTDDGELQCSICRVDFLRDPVEMIEEKFSDLAAKRMKEFAESDEGKQWIKKCDN